MCAPVPKTPNYPRSRREPPVTIKQLRIQHLRNISEAELRFNGGINFITGNNGSGKSSLLEAIYMLGRGRSFRTARFGPVVQHGRKSLTIFALTQRSREHRIGLQKNAQQTLIRIDGENVNRLSEVARITPLQILTPMSHEILERGPEYRRRFLEWGVFHVEPSYYPVYRRFIKALKQRNSLIKSAPDTLSVWNPVVGELGESLNSMRESYFELLRKHFEEELRQLEIGSRVELSWRRGWDEGVTLEQALRQKQTTDIKLGYTHAGPQRADMRLQYEDRSAFTSISRGQQKMVISALHLAQAAITHQLTGNMPILLFDDLVAELDRENRTRLLQRIHGVGCQSFITATDRPPEADDMGGTEIRINSGKVQEIVPAI